MNNRGRWRIGALASAIALLGSLASLEAHALALGRITVQSALGEPLRAEIEIADIKPDEASSLKAGVAPPDTFKAAGLEYGSVVSGVEVSLQRRADGRSFLRLTSNRPVTEPFVDLILEASWANGRITRDYTMLFDPPALRSSSAAAAPTAPVLSSRPAAPPAKGIASIPYSPPAGPSTRPAPVAKAPAAPLEKVPAGGDKQVTVKAGDTAGKIAAQNKPASVSLDQMLVALLRSNPDAFIGGNVNRIKSGAVLDIPSAETAGGISAGDASQTIVAQSKDFNSFRRKLAEGVPATQMASADRQAGGKVQAKVEDRAPASGTPDKLTLSKGAIQGKAAATAAEDKIAKERQAKEASTRVAELSKNISDLNKLGAAPAAAPAASTAKTPGVAVPAPAGVTAPAVVPAPAAAAAPTAPASTPAITPAPAPAAAVAPPTAASSTPVAASSAPASTASDAATSTAPVAAASQPTPAASAVVVPPVAAAKKPVAAPPPPPPEPSLLDELLDNPLILPIAGGLLVLLAGFGFYRYRQRGGAAAVDSSFLESRLQPDSFFGASGGQRIDTNEGNATGSSLVYSPSQLDAAGDVDPVAEADVYLAYGRDLQAEEILKEAMRTSPMRVAIHAKLMEIYAKRRDSKAFETVAIEAFNLTHGNGPEWAYITEMGRELDPANPMYQPGGQPAGGAHGGTTSAFSPGGTVAMVAQPVHVPAPTPAPAPSVDVDLDLDFSLGDEPIEPTAPAAISAPPPAPARVEPTVSMKAPEPAPLNMDFSSATVALQTAAKPAAAPAPTPEVSFLDEGLNFTPEPFTPTPKPAPAPVKAAPAPAPAPAADNGMLEFDLGALSLDLNGPTTESPAHPEEALSGSEDPLETKFLLAEEFRSLGDADGARSLAEEVMAEAKGPLKVKAQAFLNALS